MFTYNISKVADNNAYKKVCASIVSGLANIKTVQSATDVDGSNVMEFTTDDGKTITAFNDYEVDAVYVDSEVDLSKII